MNTTPDWETDSFAMKSTVMIGRAWVWSEDKDGSNAQS